MAAGVVSGSVALMIEASRAEFGVKPSPKTIKAMLQHTAFSVVDPSGRPYDVLTHGAGLVNTAGALELVQKIDARVEVNQTRSSPAFPRRP
jgi:hypothetical protein